MEVINNSINLNETRSETIERCNNARFVLAANALLAEMVTVYAITSDRPNLALVSGGLAAISFGANRLAYLLSLDEIYLKELL